MPQVCERCDMLCAYLMETYSKLGKCIKLLSAALYLFYADWIHLWIQIHYKGLCSCESALNYYQLFYTKPAISGNYFMFIRFAYFPVFNWLTKFQTQASLLSIVYYVFWKVWLN